MKRNGESNADGGVWRVVLRMARAIALVAALVFTAAAGPAAADPVTDLAFSPPEGSEPVELSALEDGDLEEVRARGFLGAPPSGIRAKKKIILWDEGFQRDLAAQAPHMVPAADITSNSVVRRGGW